MVSLHKLIAYTPSARGNKTTLYLLFDGTMKPTVGERCVDFFFTPRSIDKPSSIIA